MVWPFSSLVELLEPKAGLYQLLGDYPAGHGLTYMGIFSDRNDAFGV